MAILESFRRAGTYDGSSIRAFTFRIISNITSSFFLIQSFMTKPNDDQNQSPSSDLSIVIDSPSSSSSITSSSSSSSFSSSSFSAAASSDDAMITRILMMMRNLTVRLHQTQNMLISSNEIELPTYHVRDRTLATVTNQNHSHDQVLHSIITTFHEQDMGRHILVLTVPMVTAFISVYNRDPTSIVASLILILLSFGLTVTWNGILLREMYSRASNAIEQIGVVLIFLAFFLLLCCFLPTYLAWIPLLCFALCVLPFVFAAFHSRR